MYKETGCLIQLASSTKVNHATTATTGQLICFYSFVVMVPYFTCTTYSLHEVVPSSPCEGPLATQSSVTTQTSVTTQSSVATQSEYLIIILFITK